MTGIQALFDRAATTYDAERRVLLPDFEAFYGAALSVLEPLPRGARVLDIGAGTGLFAALVAARWPGVRFTLLDIASEMLAQAERRFAKMDAPEPTIMVGDTAKDIPTGPFDAIISALSIHHLEDAAKRKAFADIARALLPNGIFVNAEQIAGGSPAEEARLDAAWEQSVRAQGGEDGMIAAARTRMEFDRCATAEDQMSWMVDAGLTNVDCVWRRGPVRGDQCSIFRASEISMIGIPERIG